MSVRPDIQDVQAQPNLHHRDHSKVAEDDQSVIPPDHQQQSTNTRDDAGSLVQDSILIVGWRKFISAVEITRDVLMILPLLVLYLLILQAGKDDGQERRQPSEEASDARLLPHSAERPRASGNASSFSRPVPQKVLALFRFIIRLSMPLLLCLMVVLLIVGVAQRPKTDPGICSARQTDTGFVGNADFYGLGIRIGLYLQWIAATLVMRFLPSARKFMVGSYLFFHFGVIVAMCLLLLPRSCTFVPEISLIFQILWTGGALVLVPSQRPGTKFDPSSQYLTIEIISITMAIGVFAVAAWFYIGLCFHQERNFINTPGATDSFIGTLNSLHTVQAFWIGFLLYDLFERYRDKAKIYFFSEIMDWAWYTSANLATTGVVYVMDAILKALVIFLVIVDLFCGRFVDEEQHRPSDGGGSRILSFILAFSQGIQRLFKEWYRLFRALVILTLSIIMIEYTIKIHNISEVQSLNSTGQVMPLAIGVVTVLSVMYLWVKDFFSRASANTQEATPSTVEQAIGMSTSLGTWR